MKVALIPYIAAPGKTQIADQERAMRLIQRLVTFLGDLPVGTRIAIDHWEASRKLAGFLESLSSNIETLVFAWLNPGLRKNVQNKGQLEHLIQYMQQADTKLLILIVPSAFAGGYAERIINALHMNVSAGQLSTTDHSALLIDPKGRESLRIISA